MSNSAQNKEDRISIIDFGGQYAHLISRRLRDIGAYAQIYPAEEITPEIFHSKGIILSGGPRSVGKVDSIEVPEFLKEFIQNPKLPVLGICYGHQLLGFLTGGKISYSDNREYGGHEVEVLEPGMITPNVSRFQSWMSHGDHVSVPGEGFQTTGTTDNCPVAMMENKEKLIFGVQFHPEVTHTEGGQQILEKFVTDICKIQPQEWDINRYSNQLISDMKSEIGDKKVILGVSGGVDSTVSAIILQKAIGSNLHAVFIDHGLLRKYEVEEVEDYFNNQLEIDNFYTVDVSNTFLSKLEGINDPEKKREIIGHTFIDVFEQKAKELKSKFGDIEILAQGTIYTDRIESGAVGAESEKIKSHHNLTLPEKMNLSVIEPLKELYKDEVRKVGKVLGGPENILSRYPFPGPGLAVRIVGEITPERLNVLKEADYIFTTMIYDEGYEDLAWQAFAALLPVKATGVQGDNRAYGYIIALRAVSSNEGMTADFSKFSWEFLGKVSTRIINEIPEVTRVVYDISTKPPGTIEFE